MFLRNPHFLGKRKIQVFQFNNINMYIIIEREFFEMKYFLKGGSFVFFKFKSTPANIL